MHIHRVIDILNMLSALEKVNVGQSHKIDLTIPLSRGLYSHLTEDNSLRLEDVTDKRILVLVRIVLRMKNCVCNGFHVMNPFYMKAANET